MIAMRPSKRAADEMRKVSFERGVARYAEGSCLVRFGDTHVLCAASLEDKPPPWLRGPGAGLGDGGIRHAAARHTRPAPGANPRPGAFPAAPRRSSG